jgi:hypothetical protein
MAHLAGFGWPLKTRVAPRVLAFLGPNNYSCVLVSHLLVDVHVVELMAPFRTPNFQYQSQFWQRSQLFQWMTTLAQT